MQNTDAMSAVRGFNYQPGYASNSYEAWRWFDGEAFSRELKWGKTAFPKINTIRLWLSWDAYVRVPDEFLDHFEEALRICHGLGLKVIACLFNRWLRELYCYFKKCSMPQPVGISFREDHDEAVLQHLCKCCDVLIISPYYANAEMTAKLFGTDFSKQPLLQLSVIEP